MSKEKTADLATSCDDVPNPPSRGWRAKLEAQTEEVEFEYRGIPMKARYRPSVLTAKFADRLATASERNASADEVFDDVARLVSEIGDDESGFEATAAALPDLPPDFLAVLISSVSRAITGGDLDPNESGESFG